MAENKDVSVETPKVKAVKEPKLTKDQKFIDKKLKVLNTKKSAKAMRAMNRVASINEGGTN